MYTNCIHQLLDASSDSSTRRNTGPTCWTDSTFENFSIPILAQRVSHSNKKSLRIKKQCCPTAPSLHSHKIRYSHNITYKELCNWTAPSLHFKWNPKISVQHPAVEQHWPSTHNSVQYNAHIYTQMVPSCPLTPGPLRYSSIHSSIPNC